MKPGIVAVPWVLGEGRGFAAAQPLLRGIAPKITRHASETARRQVRPPRLHSKSPAMAFHREELREECFFGWARRVEERSG